ncbi:ABC transporter substrate-binding protein [Ammoniphilus sp. CFH 90114]|uniref:ABC transporter substrate-binding protein n=1 Tax=Ammoniphilus sp. CFH 90114 TaxID=2493665 RepID=UPI00100DFB9D|nr:ABC transporter substrate-binding protein [Ammoniphilus sp. CFH 90114]RXT08907.1 branched-chain amino acid ABC transporter substrate-binding protein [Ammoniphilus sp. CFH 90114]
MRLFKKKAFSIFASSVLAVSMLAGCGGGGQSTAPATNGETKQDAGQAQGELLAKIGVVSFLTGSGSAYGEAITNGLKMAQEELNEVNAGKLKVELVIEDSAGKKDQAISAVNKLINNDNVVGIIGPTLSGEMFAAGPVANQNGVPIMGTSTTAEGITDIGEYVFRNALPESIAIPEAIKTAVEKHGVKKVALMYASNNDFAVSGYKTMEQAVKDMGLEVVDTQTFADGDTDYSAQLTAVASKKPDAVLVSALYKEAGLVLAKAREMGLDVPFVGGNGFNSPQLVKQAGAAADHSYVATPWYPSGSEKVDAFVKKYTEKYGKGPDQFAAQAYDALYIMANSVLNAGVADDRDALKDALMELKDFEGVTGKFAFNENRDPVMEVKVLHIEGGEFVLVQ